MGPERPLKRLIMSTGTYSTLVAVSYLRSHARECDINYLVIESDALFEEFEKKNRWFAESLCAFHRVYVSRKGRGWATVKDVHFDEALFSHKSQCRRYWEKCVARCASCRQVIFIDEGLSSYFEYDLEVSQRSVCYYLLNYLGLFEHVFAAPRDNYLVADVKVIRELMSKSQGLVSDIGDVALADKQVLMPGQIWNQNGVCSFTEELRCYEGICRLLIAKGYSILFKDHPRNMNPFGGLLSSKLPAERFFILNIPAVYPVEVFAPKLNIAAVCGIVTTLQYSLPHLLGIPGFSFVPGFLLDKRITARFYSITSASKSLLPALDDMPDVSDMGEEQAKQELCRVFHDAMTDKKPITSLPDLASLAILKESLKAGGGTHCWDLYDHLATTECELSAELFSQRMSRS